MPAPYSVFHRLVVSVSCSHMRRSFRTLRLCAIPGVSPRAGIRCPVGAIRTPHPAERDRSEASLGSDHQNPSRTARKPLLPRASSASAGLIPRSPPYAQRSGIGPEQALKAITKNPRATRKTPSSPEPSCERRTDPAERATTASAGSIPRSVRLKKPVAEGFPTGRVNVPAGDSHP
jgi:hypothetical protein